MRARFAGVVAKVLHKPGEIVTGGSGDPVLRVVDATRLQIAAQVPLSAFERVLPGQPAVVQADTGATEAATVALRLAPAAASSTGEVRLNMPSPTTLKIDSAVQVQLLLEERRDVIVVHSRRFRRTARRHSCGLPARIGRHTGAKCGPGLRAAASFKW